MNDWAAMHASYPDLVQKPWVAHHTCGGTYVREMHLSQRGNIAVTHKHSYDHLSLLGAGVVMVDCNGQLTKYSAPTMIVIRAGVSHNIEALSDNVVWYCLHAVPDELRDAEDIGAAMDRVMIRPSPSEVNDQ